MDAWEKQIGSIERVLLRQKSHRLFATREEAEKSIEKAPETKKVRGNPYD